MVFKVIFFLLVMSNSVFAQSLDSSGSDPFGIDFRNVPDFWNGINNRQLQSAVENTKAYPTYLDERDKNIGTQIFSYTKNRFLWEFPHDEKLEFKGPMKCAHIALFHDQTEKPILWEEKNPKASNVFYHIHRSIQFYENLQKKINERNLNAVSFPIRPIPIRLEMTVDYAMWIKFSKINIQNTSKTVPDADPELWNTAEEKPEIWFYIAKRARLPSWVPSTWIPGIKDTLLGTAGFPLDTAMNPSVISHEWSHLMTKPFLGIQANTVINEIYSNYFGSLIQGSPHMASTPEYGTDPYELNFFVPEDVELPRLSATEAKNPSNEAVPKLFWRLHTLFGSNADLVIWRALAYLTPQTEVKELESALMKACSDVFKSRSKKKEFKNIVHEVLGDIL